MRPLLKPGDRVCVGAEELRGLPARPGGVVRVDRGEYDFEMMITSGEPFEGAGEGPRLRAYHGEIQGVWGLVP
jgi:hypothetical protein